jgi:hypothetical protein
MRIITVVITAGLLMASHPVFAQHMASATKPEKAIAKTYSDEENAAMAAAARAKAEAFEQARERKLRRLSRSICTGC